MFSVHDNNIAMIRGDSGIFKIDVTDVAGNVVALDDNDVLTFTLRRATRSPTIVLQKTITDGMLTIHPEDTEKMEFGMYVYDVELKRINGFVDTIIPPHKFQLLEEVTY